jgi:hypothetical protein
MKPSAGILFGIGLMLPAASAAQQAAPADPMRVRSFTTWAPPLLAGTEARRLEPIAADGRDHTVLGFAIGSAIGLAVGYGFYNLMCEAVDNNCSGSRAGTMILGAGLFGGLGALIGAVSD